MAIARDPMVDLAVATEQPRMVCIAKARGRFDKSVQHRLQIERGAADDLEHIGGGSLLLQRFTQLVEQANILDGDYCLIGEGVHQPYLPGIERSDGTAKQNDHTDWASFSQEGNAEHRSEAPY